MAGVDEDLHHMTIEVNRPYYTQANFNQAYGYAQNQSFKDYFKKIAGQYCPPTKKSCTDFILARLPFIEIMINYHAMDFLNDFFAGITIGIMHIPQGGLIWIIIIQIDFILIIFIFDETVKWW